MKKLLVVTGTISTFMLLGILLDLLLGITFPSISASVIHNLLYVADGAAVVMVLKAKIE